jgi:hypothetical protein
MVLLALSFLSRPHTMMPFVIQNGKYAMAEEIVALERTGT